MMIVYQAKDFHLQPPIQMQRVSERQGETHNKCLGGVWIQPDGRVDCVWQEVREHWGTFPAPCHPARHCCSTCSHCQGVGPRPPCWTPFCSNTTRNNHLVCGCRQWAQRHVLETAIIICMWLFKHHPDSHHAYFIQLLRGREAAAQT